MNILAKTINSKVISLPIITYPVRLSDVIRNYVHFCSVVCLKALTSGPTTLASNVQALAFTFRFCP